VGQRTGQRLEARQRGNALIDEIPQPDAVGLHHAGHRARTQRGIDEAITDCP